MRVKEFIAEGPVDAIANLGRSKAELSGQETYKVAQKLGGIAANQWINKVNAIKQAKSAAGDTSDISQAEYVRQLTDFVKTILLKNKPVEDNNSKKRINAVMAKIVQNRDNSNQVEELFTPLIQTVLGALRGEGQVSNTETPAKRKDPRISLEKGSKLEVEPFGTLSFDGYEWTTENGQTVSKDAMEKILGSI